MEKEDITQAVYLEALFHLTLVEQGRELSRFEKKIYLNLWEELNARGVEIPFGVIV